MPQLWLFWLAPIIGALIAGYLTRWLQSTSDSASPALEPAILPNT